MADEAPKPASSERVVLPLPTPGGKEAPRRTAVDLLLRIEAEARRAETVSELKFLVANETLGITPARQIFVLEGWPPDLRVAAVSSVGLVERNAPRIRWIESVVRALARDAGLTTRQRFRLPAYCPPGDPENTAYPYPFLVWLPFRLRGGDVFAGMLLARDQPWDDADMLIAERLAGTYAHAWLALTGVRKKRKRLPLKPLLAVALLAAVAAGFYPVPLTVLAPVEVTSIDPRVIVAPIDGVIDTIAVDPNQAVTKGQPLLQISDTSLRNELAVAEQNVGVAQAKLKQLTQGAVADPKMRAELKVAETELSLAVAKRDYARDLLERSKVSAPSAGVAIYTDKRDLVGRPVSTGERLMELADPDRLELRIDVPVADSIAIRVGAHVRAFLDSDPLNPIQAKVRSASFEARMLEGNVMAYRIYASVAGKQAAMRLGIRGTAQISGDKVPLAFYLFRRPIAALRQRFGL